MSQSFNTRLETGELVIKGTGKFHQGAPGDGFDIAFDGSNTLNIDPVNANDTVRIGETIQADFQVDGATDLLWDASAGALTSGGFYAGFYPAVAADDIAAGTGGAISVANALTTINTDAGGDAFTLADGTVVGQIKNIQLVADGGGNAVITPANFLDGTTITFADAGDSCSLLWNGSNWVLIANNGGTVA